MGPRTCKKRRTKLENQILNILGNNNQRNQENSKKYLSYLQQTLQLPCFVTGIEDFPWEEPYIFGGWNRQEYEEMKKTMPSCKDHFKLIRLSPPSIRDADVMAKVKRLKDNKIFEIGLSWLECINRKDPNFDEIDTYAGWHTNY